MLPILLLAALLSTLGECSGAAVVRRKLADVTFGPVSCAASVRSCPCCFRGIG